MRSPTTLGPRRAVLERRYRNTLFVGLGVAVAVHLWFLLSNPSVEGAPVEAASSIGVHITLLRPREVVVDGRAIDGSAWPLLLSNHAVVESALSRTWPRAYQRVGEGGSASLRLFLDAGGAVTTAELVEGSDDRLKDEAFLTLARQLRFSLHLDDLTPERVEVVQPVRVYPRN